MKKKFSLFGKTFLMLFLMCLVTGSAFATDKTPKNVTILADENNPAKIQTSQTDGFTFTATLLGQGATLQDNNSDFKPVTLVDDDGKEVMTVTVSSSAITLAENDYFKNKPVTHVQAHFKFAAGAWESDGYISREYTTSEAIEVYDQADLAWSPMDYYGDNGITEGATSLKMLFAAKGKKSGIVLTSTPSNDKLVNVSGTSIEGENGVVNVNKNYAITSTDGNFVINPNDLIQNFNGQYYILKVASEAFTVTYDDGFEAGKSPAYNATSPSKANLQVIAKADIKPAPNTKYVFDVTNHSFSFDMIEGFAADNRYAVSGKALAYSEGTEDKPTKITATGTTTSGNALKVDVAGKLVTVSLTEPDVFLADNAITVTIPEGAFTVNGQKNDAQTLTFTPKNIVWDTPTADAISDKDDKIVVKFGAKLGDNNENIDPVSGQKVYVKVGTAAAKDYVPEVDNDNHTFKVEIPAITTVNEATITIPAGTFKTNNSTNSATSCTVAVKPYITFPSSVTNISEIDNKAKELTFKLDVKHGDDAAAFTPDATKIKIDGTAVSTAVVETPGTSSYTPATVKVTFANALTADLHSLTFDENAILVDNSYQKSSAISAQNFEVKDYVDFTVVPTIEDASAIKFTISGKNAYDEEKNVTSTLSGSESAVTINNVKYEAKISTDDGDLVYTVKITEAGPTETEGTRSSIKLSDVASWETNPVTYSIAADLIKSENTLNGELTGTLAVDKIDPQTTTVAAANSFDVYVGPKAFTLKNGLTISDFEFKPLAEGVLVNIEPNTTKKQFVTVTLSDDNELTPNQTYTLTFKPGAIIVKDGTCNFSDVVLTISTNKVLEFDDANTVISQVPVSTNNDDLYKVNFKRNFTHTQYQAWCVPFDVKPSQLQGLTFLKLNAITDNGNNEVTMHYNTVGANDIVYAGRPYIVYAAEVGNVTATLDDVKLIDISEEKDRQVSSSTTSCTYTFTGTTEQKLAETNDEFYRLSGGKFVLTAKGNGVGAWRWYMTAQNSDVKYSKILIDEGAATGINTVNAENNANVANGAIYNIAGQRVTSPIKGQVYIMNGKKVVF